MAPTRSAWPISSSRALCFCCAAKSGSNLAAQPVELAAIGGDVLAAAAHRLGIGGSGHAGKGIGGLLGGGGHPPQRAIADIAERFQPRPRGIDLLGRDADGDGAGGAAHPRTAAATEFGHDIAGEQPGRLGAHGVDVEPLAQRDALHQQEHRHEPPVEQVAGGLRPALAVAGQHLGRAGPEADAVAPAPRQPARLAHPQAPQPHRRVGLGADHEGIAVGRHHLLRRDAQPAARRGTTPAAERVPRCREGEPPLPLGDDGHALVEGIDDVRRLGVHECGRAPGAGCRPLGRIDAQAPGIGDRPPAILEPARPGLGAQFLLDLPAGARDGPAQPGGDSDDLLVHRRADAGAEGARCNGHVSLRGAAARPRRVPRRSRRGWRRHRPPRPPGPATPPASGQVAMPPMPARQAAHSRTKAAQAPSSTMRGFSAQVWPATIHSPPPGGRSPPWQIRGSRARTRAVRSFPPRPGPAASVPPPGRPPPRSRRPAAGRAVPPAPARPRA